MTRLPHRRHAAFTLLQVLVALALAMVMLGALFAFLHDLMDSRQRVQARALRQDAVAAFFERLEADLAMVIAGEPAIGSGVAGESSSLRVLTRGVEPSMNSPRRGLLDLQRHEYRHDRMARAVVGRRGPARGGIAETIVLDGRIDHLRLRYHDGTEWLDSFDSRSAGGLPAAVEVAVWFELPEALRDEILSQAGDDEPAEEATPSGDEAGAAPRETAPRSPRASTSLRLPPPDRLRVISIPDGGAAKSAPDERPVEEQEPPLPDGEANRSRDALPSRRGRGRRSASGRSDGRSCRETAVGWRPTVGRRPARSFLLIAVLVALAIALAVVSGMLMLARGEAATVATRERQAQSRALAWSGAQAVGVLLEEQRDRLLAGESPTLPSQVTIFEASATLGVVRLLPVGRDGRGEPTMLRPEGGLLDLNRADAAVLAATGMVDAAQAEVIVSARGLLGGRFLSESELLEIPGLAPERLFGSLEALAWAADIRRRGDWERAGVRERSAQERRIGGERRADPGSSGGDAGVQATAQGLLDVLTVFAVEPLVRRDGQPRLSLAQGWSEDLGRTLSRELPRRMESQSAENAVRSIEALYRGGGRIESEQALCRILSAEASAGDLAGLLDVVTIHPGPWVEGRVDINSAPYEAILALEGVSEQQAAEIVREREGLSLEERWTPTWILARGIVDRSQFEDLIGRITARCLLWRVRLAAGEVLADDPDGPLENAIAWEAVFDLTGPRWRLAYLRDATLLPLAAALTSSIPEPEPSEQRRGPDAAGGVQQAMPSDGQPSERAEPSTEEIAPEPAAGSKDDAPTPDPPRRAGGRGAGRGAERSPGGGRGARQGGGEAVVGGSGAVTQPATPRGPGPVGRWRTQ